MLSYHIFEWILFFYIYCFLGWVFESTYVSIKSKRFVNRGFMKGPMIPIYGEGAIMMLVATTPVQGNLVLEFVMGMIGATLLEYVVGALMESVFKVKYWDYSNQHFHIKGYICLSSSICWGALSVLMAEVIHLPIERFVLSLDYTVLVVIALVVTTIFITDVVTSAKEAWNLRIVLVALTKARGEIAALQHQLELKKVQITEQFVDKKEELVEDWQAKKDFLLQSLKGNLQSAVDTENIKAKLDEELTKYQSLIEKFTSTSIWILKRNPGATSKKFYEALENVKEHIDFKRKNK
ncbi:putative membrane protein [Lachnotalea glycerini]|uniref:Putative membrane protein n=1 Tax=Lachnotalea glycerini TaxID=1763509 RepID=A0A255IIN1_9FIRM|nr:putative ABC transporter permease [Lachnotalea glycerini]PXV95438.1 putative membrane protein [Lachnotalea glycerini]RDY32758.1 hypothetical protein CG710_002155 [Lachnotalea glycerini]